MSGPWRQERIADPRAIDYPEDSALWVWLFEQAYDAGEMEILAWGTPITVIRWKTADCSPRLSLTVSVMA